MNFFTAFLPDDKVKIKYFREINDNTIVYAKGVIIRLVPDSKSIFSIVVLDEDGTEYEQCEENLCHRICDFLIQNTVILTCAISIAMMLLTVNSAYCIWPDMLVNNWGHITSFNGIAVLSIMLLYALDKLLRLVRYYICKQQQKLIRNL